MDKIVVVHEVPATWDCGGYKIILCFRYDSPERWLVDFEKCLVDTVTTKKSDWDAASSEFIFCGYLFDAHDFGNMYLDKLTYDLPSVYLLDEWFDKNLQETLK